MAAREKRILDLADELLSTYPHAFKADYAYNMDVLHRSQYFDGPVSAQTLHKVAGAVAQKVRQYEFANPEWREDLERTGHVTSGRNAYSVSGSRSAGRPKKKKQFFPSKR